MKEKASPIPGAGQASIPSPDFKLLFQAVPDPCLVLDPSLVIVSVNDAYLRATRTKGQEIIGHGIFDIFPDNPEQPDATGVRNLAASLKRVLRDRVPDVMSLQKYDIRRPDEEGGGFEERYWSPINTPVLGPDSRVLYIIHRVQDVTGFVRISEEVANGDRIAEALRERAVHAEAEIYGKTAQVAEANITLKQTSEELEAQRIRLLELNAQLQDEMLQERMLLSSLVASSTEPMISLTKDLDGVIKTWNKGAERVYGYRAEEVIGRNIDLLIPPGRDDDTDLLLQTAARGGHLTDYETLRRKKDGTLLHVLLTVSPIKDTDGKIIGVSVTGSDITRRKAAEAERERSLAELEAILESINEGILLCDLEGNVLKMNRRALVLHDLPEDGTGRMTLAELRRGFEVFDTAGELLPVEQWPLSRMLRGEPFFDHVVQVRHKLNDRVRILSYNGTAVRDKAGQQILMVFTIRDVTERQLAVKEIERLNRDLAERALELEAANKQLEAFNYSVAHDLRQPLSLISSYCQMITRMCASRLGGECVDYLRKTLSTTLRMDALIACLLDFSRISRVELQRTTVSLSEVAREVARDLEMAESQRRIEFRIEEGLMANCDPNLLRVVFSNLLGNAVKYSGNTDSSVIEVGAMVLEGEVTYFVKDNGMGFGKEDAAKIFIPFQRLPGAQEQKGFGIGLATVESVIRRHGGRIWAEGESGHGATFYFTLPDEESRLQRAVPTNSEA